jgi:hypothetical protein
VRTLKFVFAAGVVQEGADCDAHRLRRGSLRFAGVTNPSSGSERSNAVASRLKVVSSHRRLIEDVICATA